MSACGSASLPTATGEEVREDRHPRLRIRLRAHPRAQMRVVILQRPGPPPVRERHALIKISLGHHMVGRRKPDDRPIQRVALPGGGRQPLVVMVHEREPGAALEAVAV